MASAQKIAGFSLIVFSIALIILLTLIQSSLQEQGAFLCEAVAADPDVEMTDCPAHNASVPWLLTAAFGVAFLILGAGIFLLFIPLSIEKKVKIDLSKLTDEESIIVNLLKDRDNSIYQSDMIKQTEFSKVKLTRILDKLESKGLIERKRRGMTNLVILK